MSIVRIGIGQFSPVHLDVGGCLEKLKSIFGEAEKKGVNLLVMGETWVSGYPAWLDHCPDIGKWGHEPMKEVYRRFYESSMAVPGEEFQFLCELVRKSGIMLCVGVNEKVKSGPGNGTVYNSLLLIGKNGELLNHHRKLVPTFTEKLLYGYGDGKGLHAADTPYGRVGGSICWEHWMPLSRQSLHDSGEHIHVALWPTVHPIHEVASRHYAFEGRCFVIAAGQLLSARDFPVELALPDYLKKDTSQYVLRGGSSVYAPDGAIVIPPVFDREELIVCDIETDKTIKERMTLDTSGHYQRRDVFTFVVNATRW